MACLAVTFAFAGCDSSGRGKFARDIQRELKTAREEVAILIQAQEPGNPALADEQVIMLGYFERLRLGLGSPFRLIEYAYMDPRLSGTARSTIAWALLDATLDRRAYRIQPRGLGGMETGAGTEPLHLELIEQALRSTRDPRTGEIAVRTAYMLAAAEGSVGAGAPLLAAKVAALVRDQEIARRDAVRLLRSASERGSDPFVTLSSWRNSHQFEVEAPPAASPSPASDLEAAKLAPKLALKVRLIAMEEPPEAASAGDIRHRPVLSLATALRLAALADALNAPPQTPVWGTLGAYRRGLEQQPGVDSTLHAALHRFVHRSSNEEHFAAEHAIAFHALDGASPWVAHATLRTAVAMRTYAQERVWYPGYAAPTMRELKARHRIASLSFDRSVPAAWQPYYQRMVGEALADLSSVFPKLDLRGLHLRIGRTGMDNGVLASHSPERRTIYLPPGLGAGTIAHEVAHDLDWQVGKRKYKTPGSYATDLAISKNYNDQFAAAMRSLPLSSGPASGWHYGNRPAEIFARSVDWYVVSALAARGRSNGYLSAIQDDVLRGLGSVETPYPIGENAVAFSRLLTVSSALPEQAVDAFLVTHGPKRPVLGSELVTMLTRDLLRARPRASRFDGVLQGNFAAAFALLDSARQELGEIESSRAALHLGNPSTLPAEQRQLVDFAAEARARGVLVRYAQIMAGASGRQWMRILVNGTAPAFPYAEPEAGLVLRRLAALAGYSVPEPEVMFAEEPWMGFAGALSSGDAPADGVPSPVAPQASRLSMASTRSSL
jgi:hypothetical protein